MKRDARKSSTCYACQKRFPHTSSDWRAELTDAGWLVIAGRLYCADCDPIRKRKPAPMEAGARKFLIPGQVLFRDKTTSQGMQMERITYLDRCNDARFLMSARLDVNDELRAVGNLYGGSVQLAEYGHGVDRSFVQEAVDGGKHATGGVTPAMIDAMQIAKIARAAMDQQPSLHHRTASRKFKSGPHLVFPLRSLADMICVYGLDITEAATRAGWWLENRDSGKRFVAKQQSQKLKAGLITALETIDAAFQDHGIDARRMGIVRVR